LNNKYINYLIVAYAFCIPLSRAAIVTFSMLLIILWIVSIKNDTRYYLEILKNNKVIVTLGLLVLAYFVSLIYSDNLYEGFRHSYKYWYYLVIPVIMTKLEKQYISKAVSAFLLGMMISEILSYGIFFELWSLNHGTPSDPSPFMNHLQYSMFLAFTALLVLNRVFNEQNIKYKIGYMIYFLTVTINLFINGGRTGQVAFVVSIFIVGFLNIKNKFKSFILILMLISSILITAYNFSPVFKNRVSQMKNNIEQTVQNNNFSTSVGIRLGFYIITWEIFKDHGLIGVGAGDVMDTVRDYANILPYDFDKLKTMPNTHSDLLEIVITLGLVGVVLYLLLLYNIIKLNIQDKEYKNLPIIFVSVYFISSMFETMFHEQFSMAIFALFVGLFLAEKRLEDNKVQNKECKEVKNEYNN